MGELFSRGYLLLGIFILFPFLVFSNSRSDSLKRVLSKAENEKEEIEILLELLDHYNARFHDSTFIIGNRLLELAVRNENTAAEARCLLIIGFWKQKEGNFLGAKKDYLKAIDIAVSNQFYDLIPPLYANLGVAYQRAYQQDSAYYFLTKAEQAYEQVKDRYEIWKVYKSLFEFYSTKNDTTQARIYAHKAFDIVDNGGNRIDRGYLLFQLTSYFLQIGQFSELAFFKEKWVEYQAEKKTSLEFMETPEHIAMFMFDEENNELIEEKLKEAIQYFEKKDNPYRAGWCHEDLGDFYHSVGRLDAAEPALLSALSNYERCGASYRRGRALYKLYQLQKERGQFAEALTYLESYKALADSLASVEVEENLNELKVQYETEKKEQALLIKELELNQKTQERNLLMASSLMLALLALGIFLSLRYRIRFNRRLADQESKLQKQRILQLEQEKRLDTMNAMIEGQEKERHRIANDLHDSLGGLLTSAKAHFGSIQEKVALPQESGLVRQTGKLLDDAGVELRRISQNLMPRSLYLLGLKGAVEDVAAQLRLSGLDCKLEFIGLQENLPQTLSITLFRIIQELANNVQKHAMASKVLIQLIQHKEELNLIMEDDGKGFILKTALRKKSLGFTSLQSRVEFLQGEMDVDSKPGEGTSITISVPVD